MEDFEEKLNSILSSPEAMGQIMSLANSLSGGGMPTEPQQPQPEPTPSSGTDNNPFALLQGLDPGMLQKAMNLFRTYNNGNNEKTALLTAIRPFLREDRRGRLDRAIQIARYSGVIRAALREFRGGENV